MGVLESIRAAAASPEIEPVRLPPEIDHLSASSINQYLRCPRQWWYRYVLGLRVPPDGGLVVGKGVHWAAEAGMKGKIISGLDPEPESSATLAAEAVEAECSTGEVRFEEGQTTGQLKDKAARVASAWAEKAAPKSDPAEVEAEFEKEIAGVKVIGRLDVVDRDGLVRDWKTSGRKPVATDVMASVQTEIYSHVRDAGVVYHYLVDGKTGVAAHDVPVVGKNSALAAKLAPATVGEVAKGISAEVFPRKRDGWHCSVRWCGFYERCMSGKDRP